MVTELFIRRRILREVFELRTQTNYKKLKKNLNVTDDDRALVFHG